MAKSLRPAAIGVAIALVALFGMVSVASAISAPISGAEFDTQCGLLGGTLVGNGSGKTCTVTTQGGSTDVETMPAGESGNAWIATVTTSGTVTVYTWNNAAAGGVSTNTTGGGTEVTKCTNPGGQEMDLSHQNCQLP